jgi:hypothetical protein
MMNFNLGSRYTIKDKSHGWYGFRVEKPTDIPMSRPLAEGYSMYRVIDPNRHFNSFWTNVYEDKRFKEVFPEIGWYVNESEYIPQQAYKDEYIANHRFTTLEKAKTECMQYHLKLATTISKMKEE